MSEFRRRLFAGMSGRYSWLIDAFEQYPILAAYKDNLIEASKIDPDIRKTFDGTGRYMMLQDGATIRALRQLQQGDKFRVIHNSPSGAGFIIGNRDSSTRQGFYIMLGAPSVMWGVFSYSTSWSQRLFTTEYDKDLDLIADTSAATLTYRGSTVSLPQKPLFTSVPVLGIQGKSDTKYKIVQFTGNDFLIPFVNSNGECGMYDVIGRHFYGNASTSGTITII